MGRDIRVACSEIDICRHMSRMGASYPMEWLMRTVSIFKNARNQAIRIPKDMEFEG